MGKVSANRPPGIFLISPDAVRSAERAARRDRLGLVTYWAEAGIASTAAGAWASAVFSGRARFLVWMGVSATLAAIAILFAGPAVSFLGRCYRMGRDSNRPDGS